MFKRIDHVEIVTSNLDRAIDFYTNVLGFKVKERMKVGAGPLEELAYIELGDTVIELMYGKNYTPITTEPWQIGYHAVALEVANMDEAVAYLKEKGVAIVWGPVALGPTTKRAEIRDTDGLAIELRQW